MTESEPWSYHPDGSLVYSLADIIRKRPRSVPSAQSQRMAPQAAHVPVW